MMATEPKWQIARTVVLNIMILVIYLVDCPPDMGYEKPLMIFLQVRP